MQTLEQDLWESTGKYRKCVIWLLHITISVQHWRFSIRHSIGQHFIRVTAYWGCKQAAGTEESGLSLMRERTEAKLLLASLFSPNGNEANVRFSLLLKQARCFLLWILAGMSNNDVLRHALQLHPVKTFLRDCQWTGKKRKKDVEELATNFTLHPSWVKRARQNLKSSLKTIYPHSLPWKYLEVIEVWRQCNPAGSGQTHCPEVIVVTEAGQHPLVPFSAREPTLWLGHSVFCSWRAEKAC